MSLLFPSLSGLVYQQELVACKAKLRNIHFGVSVYAEDYNGYYPRNRAFRMDPIEFGYQSASSLTIEEKRQRYGSIVNIMRPFFDQMKTSFMCDTLRANEKWEGLSQMYGDADSKLNYDENDHLYWSKLASGYALYFNAAGAYKTRLYYNHPTDGGIINARNNPDSWLYPDNIMQQVGDTFTFKPADVSAPFNIVANFDIIASDYMLDRTELGVHTPPEYIKTEHGRAGHHPNYAYSRAPVFDMNLVFSDGSVRKLESLTGARTSNFRVFYGARQEGQYYIPSRGAEYPAFPVELNLTP